MIDPPHPLKVNLRTTSLSLPRLYILIKEPVNDASGPAVSYGQCVAHRLLDSLHTNSEIIKYHKGISFNQVEERNSVGSDRIFTIRLRLIR